MTFIQRVRKFVAAGLCCSFSFCPLLAAQETNIRVDKPHTFPIRSYQGADVPPINARSSGRFAQLIRGTNLYLTVQDAIALALENDIDLEIQRYSPLLSFWAVQRAEAGGAQRGVNTGTGTNFGVTAGQGVQGTANVVGNTGGNFTGTGAGTGSGAATISQIGPVAPNFDPVFQNTTFFSHRSNPQANPFRSGVTNLIDNRKNYQNSLSEGFPTGGSATISFNEGYLNENATTNNLNPTVSPVLGVNFSHNLLNGFGLAVNSVQIRVAKSNLNVSDLNFQNQVITILSNVLTLYWGLVSDIEDVRAKESSLALAQQLYSDNKKQVQLGTMAPLDITQAESQVASSQRDLIFSQTAAQQQEVRLKDVLSRRGAGDPAIADVHIIPLDHIQVPESIQSSPLQSLVDQALKARVDITAEQMNLENTRTTTTSTTNGIRPTLRVFGSVSNQGLAGQTNPVAVGVPPPDAYFLGGFGTAVGQVFRNNFPTRQVAVIYNENIRNDLAQGDYGYDQLKLRQTELRTQKDRNQVAVDISNETVALQQAHTRYQAAVRSRILEEQLVSAEQKKYKLGTSTTFAVIQVQRDLATAKSNEIAAIAQFANAKIGLERVLGTTLETYAVSLDEAKSGRVTRVSTIPATPHD
jgi:outer membrane protein TolC